MSIHQRTLRLSLLLLSAFAVTSPIQANADEVKTKYLDTVERLVRWLHRHQDEDGAIIDILLKREYQYTTPYYCFALYTCRAAGRCEDMEDSFSRAMDHCTAQVERGSAAIPDQHGEFFLASLGELMWLIRKLPDESAWINPDKLAEWRKRLSVPVNHVIEGMNLKLNNHRTYAMKGEHYRAKAELIPQEDADAFIEDAWENRGIKYRVGLDATFSDWNGEPQSEPVSAVGMGNLFPIAFENDAVKFDVLRQLLRDFIYQSFYKLDLSGQCPPNGRTDNHVFNDALYCSILEYYRQIAFENRNYISHEDVSAGKWAKLCFSSMARWRRHDAPYDGIYSITKNHFDPADRVGYQPASQVSNYTAAVALLIAEAYWGRRAIGTSNYGRSMSLDSLSLGDSSETEGGSTFTMNLQGDTVPKYGIYWTPLGLVRLSRYAWDSRLGPSDGQYDGKTGIGLTLAPTWRDGGKWVHLSEMAQHYRGVKLVEDPSHPQFIDCFMFAPVTGVGGPMFEMKLRAIEQGIVMSFRSPTETPFGVTLPILTNDGRELLVSETSRSVSVRYPDELSDGSEQHFIVLGSKPMIQKTEARVLSSYGWLQEYRARARDPEIHLFAYMRRDGEPPLEAVLSSIEENPQNFQDNPADALKAAFDNLISRRD